MAAGSGRYNKGLEVPKAHKALDNMKYEIAAELNLPVQRSFDSHFALKINQKLPYTPIRRYFFVKLYSFYSCIS